MEAFTPALAAFIASLTPANVLFDESIVTSTELVCVNEEYVSGVEPVYAGVPKAIVRVPVPRVDVVSAKLPDVKVCAVAKLDTAS